MKIKSRRPTPVTDRKFPLLPRLIATSFGAGYLPVAPGTWGALLAIVLWLPLYVWCEPSVALWTTVAATVIYAVAGTWASTESEKYWGKDPVIACADETVGQWISLIPLCGGPAASPWWLILLAFALFRLFDIFKPLGIRRLERLPGGIGMMADDVAAGVLAAIIVYLTDILI